MKRLIAVLLVLVALFGIGAVYRYEPSAPPKVVTLADGPGLPPPYPPVCNGTDPGTPF